MLWLAHALCIFAQDSNQSTNVNHFSLFSSLDKSVVRSISEIDSKLLSSVIKEPSPAIAESTKTSALLASEIASSRSSWIFSTPVSEQVQKPELDFIRYERDELAYQPYFEDILYFSCETWVPNDFGVSGKGMLADQARLILENYFVVPYSEWKRSYDSSQLFWNYARLRFPENNVIRLLTTQNGLALLLYKDGGAVFLTNKLEKYQLDLVKIHKGRLRTSEL